MSFPIEGVFFNKKTMDAVGNQLRAHLAEMPGDYRLQIKPWTQSRSLNQNRLSHMWYGEISEWLIRRGKTFASPRWVKDAMKHTYLGYEDVEHTDVVTGAKTTVQQLRHTSELKTGEMYDFLCKVEAWAMTLGILLTIPQNCEFMQNRERQTK